MTHSATHFRTEYLKNPMGIDTPIPHFSWRMESQEAGARQTAYELTVATGGKTVWTTGKVQSAESTQIAYAGPALARCTRYDVTVVT